MFLVKTEPDQYLKTCQVYYFLITRLKLLEPKGFSFDQIRYYCNYEDYLNYPSFINIILLFQPKNWW